MAPEAVADGRVPMWLDCDPGHDDAIAIILAGHSPNVELLGISTVAGNQTVTKCTRNALDVLSAASLTGISVVEGQAKPLMRSSAILCPEIHGVSGLDSPDHLPLLPSSNTKPLPGKAPVIMFEAIHAAWQRMGGGLGRVRLVCTGSLSNAALLLLLYPEVVDYVEMVVMGGCLGIGNTHPVAEFNIQTDPEAAKIVFESGAPLTMVGLEVTHLVLATPGVICAVATGAEAAERAVVAGDAALYPDDSAPTATTRGAGVHAAVAARTAAEDAAAAAYPASAFRAFVARLLVFFAETYRRVFEFQHPPVHDPLTVAYVMHPELFRTMLMRVDVETTSTLCAGQTVCDRWGQSPLPPNCNVALSVDVPAFWGLVLDAVRRADAVSPLNATPPAKAPRALPAAAADCPPNEH
uniref:Inosine/uridine-preferring nucleoside hydrolase domain-containing protein n=1 Tax=Chlamydomonas euryale TaxID=1486919 RepID=A0A7R9YS21_9CHLO